MGDNRAPFRPFNLSVWNSRIPNLTDKEFTKYSKFYSFVLQANFMAEKIKYGEYQEEEGIFYVNVVLNMLCMDSYFPNKLRKAAEGYQFNLQSLLVEKSGDASRCDHIQNINE